jgi:O-antigen ligase
MQTGRGRAAAAPAPARPLKIDGLQIALFALLFVWVWRIQDRIPLIGAVQIPTIAALSACLLYFSSKDPRRQARGIKHPILTLVLVFAAVIVVSAPFAMYKAKAVNYLLFEHYKKMIIMLLLALSVRSIKDVERWAAVNVVAAVVYSVLTIKEYGYQVAEGGRLGGLGYYDTNDFAFILVLTIPQAVYFLRKGVPTRLRIIALGALGVIVFSLTKTGSRGGFLGFIAVGAFMLFRFTALPARTRISSIVALVLGLVVVGSDKYWEMMSSILNPKEDYNMTSDTGRMEIWKRGIGYMLENPILGVGPRNFSVAEGSGPRAKERMEMGIGTQDLAPHNSFVQVGAELGITGLVVFVLLLFRIFLALFRIEQAAPPTGRAPPEVAMAQALEASMVGFCVSGFFLTQADAWYLYALIGMVMGLVKVGGGGVRVASARPGRRAAPRLANQVA